jgi:hypothetical protein
MPYYYGEWQNARKETLSMLEKDNMNGYLKISWPRSPQERKAM